MSVSNAFALYKDEIANVETELVWQAARNALGEEGKIDKEGKTLEIETPWRHDRVERRRPLLPFLPKKFFERRSKFDVSLERDHYSTHIEVRGTFQQQRIGSSGSAGRDRVNTYSRFKRGRPEYDAERDLFHAILKEVSLLKARTNAV